MLTWAQVAKGEDCKSYEYTPSAVRLRPSALKNYKNIQYGLPRLEFIAILFGTMIREIIENIDKLDDSYCSIAQLVE